LIGTSKSIWDGAYEAFGGTAENYQIELMEQKDSRSINEASLIQFNEQVSAKLGSVGSKASLIDYGVDEDELWGIFEKYLEIAENIEDGDELYLDITHSFRSLAMMSLVMTQFASSISGKKFTIKGVYYGMLEYQSETSENIAPIVNLNILFELQEWIKAIDAIKKYSDFDPLVEILEKEGVEDNVAKAFIHLNNAIDMGNMASIQSFVKSAGKKIRAIGESDNKVIKLLASEVTALVDELDHEKMSDFQYALAKWFYNNKNFAMSYMALAEAIITKACEIKGYDIKSREGREAGKDYMKITKYDDDFSPKYANGISQIRNNIAHQLDSRGAGVDNDIKKLSYFIERFAPFFLDKNK
jgi:CRISPR-associated Csx2 family protein